MITASTYIIVTEHARRRFTQRVCNSQRAVSVGEILRRTAKAVPITDERRTAIELERLQSGLRPAMREQGRISYYLMDEKTVLVFERLKGERLRLVTLWNIHDPDAE